MDTLTLSTICILCTASAPATVHSGTWQPVIAEAAGRFGIPEAWIDKVMQAESGGRTTLDGRPTTSGAGAMGLMQVMPKTYSKLRQRYGLGADPYAARDNILAGAAYLKEMYVRYGYPNLFAAYNAGPGTFDRFLLAHAPLPPETLRYVDAIIPGGSLAFGEAKSPSITAKSGAPASLFVALNTAIPAGQRDAKPPSSPVPIVTDHTETTAAARASLFVALTPASGQ